MQFDKAYVEGISGPAARTDIQYAEQLGYRIKLLGIAKRSTDSKTGAVRGIELRVHPTPGTHESRLIANVEGAMNAVMVHG